MYREIEAQRRNDDDGNSPSQSTKQTVSDTSVAPSVTTSVLSNLQ